MHDDRLSICCSWQKHQLAASPLTKREVASEAHSLHKRRNVEINQNDQHIKVKVTINLEISHSCKYFSYFFR